MVAVTRALVLAAMLAACLSTPDLPPAHGVSRSWVERDDQLADGAPTPGQIIAPRLVYDPRRQRVLLYGGGASGDATFELDPAAGWRLVCDPCTGTGRDTPGLVYDPINERVLLFGGAGRDAQNDPIYFNDLWALFGDTWSLVPTTGIAPDPRSATQMIFDEAEQVLWLIGGYGFPGDPDAFKLDSESHWSTAPAPGATELANRGNNAIYDPQRQRILVMEDGNVDSSELWEHAEPAHWQLFASMSSPTERTGGGLIHIPGYDQTLWVGGYSADLGHELAGTEVLVGDHFEPFSPLPPARSDTGIAYDPSRDVVVMYGGAGSDADCSTFGCEGTWELRRD